MKATHVAEVVTCILVLAALASGQAADPGPRGGTFGAGLSIAELSANKQRLFATALSQVTGVEVVQTPRFVNSGPKFNGNPHAQARRALFLSYSSGQNRNIENASRASTTEARLTDLSRRRGTIYMGGAFYENLASALASCPFVGCVVEDALPEEWLTNVISTARQGTHIYLGAGTWTTVVTQNLPANVILTGEAGRNAGQQGTAIQAASGFPTSGAPVIQLGAVGAAIEGVRVENLTIDCNDIANTTGIYDDQAQEKSGARDVLITACPNMGVDVESGGQGSHWYNIEVFPSSWNNACHNCGASTVLFNLNSVENVSIEDTTLNGDGPATNPSVGLQITNSSAYLKAIHIESVAKSGIDIAGGIVETQAVSCSHGAVEILKNCIVIELGVQNATFVDTVVDAFSTNILEDIRNGNTLVAATEGYSLGLYSTGNGLTQSVITSSIHIPSRFSGRIVPGTSSVEGLPPAADWNKGQETTVNNSTPISAEGQICASGGSDTALAFSNGSVWKCF